LLYPYSEELIKTLTKYKHLQYYGTSDQRQTQKQDLSECNIEKRESSQKME